MSSTARSGSCGRARRGRNSLGALRRRRPVTNEQRLVVGTLARRFLKELPKRLIGDRAYDSDPLAELAAMGVEMTSPHHPRRRFRSRRRVTRYEHKAENYLGFVQLACAEVLWSRLRVGARGRARPATRADVTRPRLALHRRTARTSSRGRHPGVVAARPRRRRPQANRALWDGL
jgi:hypothetical protein